MRSLVLWVCLLGVLGVCGCETVPGAAEGHEAKIWRQDRPEYPPRLLDDPAWHPNSSD